MSAFADDLIQSLEEAVRMSKSEEIGTIHHPIDPREVRKRADLTQAQMAPLMGMSLSGYRKWEQGRRTISGPALNLLRVIEKNPAAVVDALS